MQGERETCATATHDRFARFVESTGQWSEHSDTLHMNRPPRACDLFTYCSTTTEGYRCGARDCIGLSVA